MGILDDAIREHLDLKRKHGAREAELREIEDEAFGSGEQPDPFAAGGELFAESAGGEEPTRLVQPEALRPEPAPSARPETEQAPRPETAPVEPATHESTSDALVEPVSPPEGLAPIPGQTELPGQDEIPGQERLVQPIEEYRPSEEPAPEPPAASESLEALIAEEEPFPEDSAAPAPETPERPGPSADLGGALAPPAGPSAPEPAQPEADVEPHQGPESSLPEPHEEPVSSVPDPPPPPPGPEPPGRARGRADVPTQEHPPPGQTGDLPPLPSERPEPLAQEPVSEAVPLEESGSAERPELETGAPELYDFETDDEPLAAPEAGQDDFEALGPAEEEAPDLDEEQPYADEPSSDAGAPLDEPGTAVRPALEDEEAYEGGAFDAEESYEEDDTDEGLWFEKGPPKDFDFDD